MSTGYDIFLSQIEAALEAFPMLLRVISGEWEVLRGTLPIIDANGRHWEDFEIEIRASENFPNEFPHLFELSGKIPKIADWHIYEDTGACCVKVKPEEIIRCVRGITLKEYITEEVLPYLFNQTHRRVEGYYVNGEYAHGIVGIYEYYARILRSLGDIDRTVWLMQYIARNVRPIRTSMCFCGSAEKYRHCHRAAFEELKLLGEDKLEMDARRLFDLARKINPLGPAML